MSLDRNPAITSTCTPRAWRALAWGKAMAQPTPPPMTATRFTSGSTSVAVPSGPTKSRMSSPASRPSSSSVVRPTFWKMMVTVPAARS